MSGRTPGLWTVGKVHKTEATEQGVVQMLDEVEGYAVRRIWRDEQGRRCTSFVTGPIKKADAEFIAEQDAIIEELGAIIEELVGALTERADSCEANITFSDVEWQTGPCECVDCNQNRALIAKATKASSG